MTDRLPQVLEEETVLEDSTETIEPAVQLEEDLVLNLDGAVNSEGTTALEESTGPTPPPVLIVSHVTHLPHELQVNILTYLRAYDLASVHQTCRFYSDATLVHSIVVHASEQVYPLELTQGFEQQPVMSRASSGNNNSVTNNKAAVGKKGRKKGPAVAKKVEEAAADPQPLLYTFEHLRNMELLVVARVLSRPEPPSEDGTDGGAGGGYFVSKSWCKTALKWLEWQQERQEQYAQQQAAAAAGGHHGGKKKNKLSKKQQRLRQRKYSDANPPWPNVNSDILCEHAQLMHCSNRKSARARRKILDKQAWKCLKKLYPDSVALETKQGECWQCVLEAETEKKAAQQEQEKLKEERKAPLSQSVVRRFYTRTRGVPLQCLVGAVATGASPSADVAGRTLKDDEFGVGICSENGNDDSNSKEDEEEDRKMPATPVAATKIVLDDLIFPPEIATKKSFGGCPLQQGMYYVLPRAWCHAWRKYIKTGDGGPLLPPDASALLCDAHRLPLLPPHLESYLYGESPQLYLSKKQQQDQEQQQLLNDSSVSSFTSPVARRSVVVGMSPPAELPLDLQQFLTPAELAQQQRAMMTLERQREQREQQHREQQHLQEQQQQQDGDGRRASWSTSTNTTTGEQLDRENYCCVEIVSPEELEALEKLWPSRATTSFQLKFHVSAGQDATFDAQPCRECDASGMANFCKIPKTSKAHLRAAHQTRVRLSKGKECNNNTSISSSSGGGNGSNNSKPGVQLEY